MLVKVATCDVYMWSVKQLKSNLGIHILRNVRYVDAASPIIQCVPNARSTFVSGLAYPTPGKSICVTEHAPE